MDEQLFNLLISSSTRFNENTKNALKDVKVHGEKQSDVARKYGVSRQFINTRVRRFNTLEKKFFQDTEKYQVYLVKNKIKPDEEQKLGVPD